MRAFAVQLLSRLVQGIAEPPSFAPLAERPGQFLVVSKSGSPFVEALLRSLAKRRGIALGRVGADPGPATSLLWCDLSDSAAVEAAAAMSTSRRACTLNIFGVRGPAKSYPSRRMSTFDELALLFNRTSLHVFFGTPLPAAEPEPYSPSRLDRLLKVDFSRNLKLVRGMPFESLERQRELIVESPESRRDLQVLADRTGQTKERAAREARAEFERMAANPRRWMYVLLAPVAQFIIRRLFSRVFVEGLDDLAKAIRARTVVLVPMHRSHLDYILVGSQLYTAGFNPPLVAAGMNLAFWPAGFIARSVGAYFVRRNARHNRVHVMLLKRYVGYLLRRGYLQEFFIEGGRSRSGRMLPPRLGLLGIMVDTFLQQNRDDLLFVPVAITYENVIEDQSFGEENTGRGKRRENLVELVRARSVFRKKYGEVILSFGKPLSLAALAATPIGRDRAKLTVELGQQLTRRIGSRISPSPTSLGFASLMMAPGYALSRARLESSIRNLARLATWYGQFDRQAGSFTPALQQFLDGNSTILADLTRSKVMEQTPCLGQDIFHVPGRRRFTADFYKNGCGQVFFFPALLALLELLGEPLTAEAALKLKPFFDYDFLLPGEIEFTELFERYRSLLTSAGVLRTENGGFTFASREEGLFIPAFLYNTLESLMWVELNLAAGRRARSFIPYQEFLAELQDGFKIAGSVRVVRRTEAASKSALVAALESLQQRQFIAIQERDGQKSGIKIVRDSADDLTKVKQVVAVLETFLEGMPVLEAEQPRAPGEDANTAK